MLMSNSIEDQKLNSAVDKASVEFMAGIMTVKLSKSRRKGRGGWFDPDVCSVDDLKVMLKEHVEKGQFDDVANFAMMIHLRETEQSWINQIVQDQENTQ
jgi:hypothetical protein